MFIMNDVERLQVWISHVFDHPVTEPAWYWSEDEFSDEWPDAPAIVVTHIAETFEQGRELLSRYSDEQLDQGFWYLFDDSRPGFMRTLLDEEIPVAARLRALLSFVPLFEQVMAPRCSPVLSHLHEQPTNPLNSACYMWFDEVLDRFFPERLERSQLEKELFLVLRPLLAVPHDACRESALHGVGHWVRQYPQLAHTVDEFLSNTHDLRPELIAYAERARVGNVL
jgi:hypothetical protein